MSRLLSSSHGGLVLATAMAVSAGTFILLDLIRDKNSHTHHPDSVLPEKPALRPCLCSGGKKRDANKKKRVRFADDVKDSSGNGKEYRKERKKKVWRTTENDRRRSCGNEILEIPGMPPNRAALYSGILRDRLNKLEFSF